MPEGVLPTFLLLDLELGLGLPKLNQDFVPSSFPVSMAISFLAIPSAIPFSSVEASGTSFPSFIAISFWAMPSAIPSSVFFAGELLLPLLACEKPRQVQMQDRFYLQSWK